MFAAVPDLTVKNTADWAVNKVTAVFVAPFKKAPVDGYTEAVAVDANRLVQ